MLNICECLKVLQLLTIVTGNGCDEKEKTKKEKWSNERKNKKTKRKKNKKRKEKKRKRENDFRSDENRLLKIDLLIGRRS